MKKRRPALVASVVAVVITFSTFISVLAVAPPVHGLDGSNMDFSIDPRADFYHFANGGWLNRTTIPSDKGSYGVFDELDDRTTQQLLTLLHRLAASGGVQVGTDEWKAVRLFEQGTGLKTRNTQGMTPIKPILDEIAAVNDLTGFHRFLEGATFRGVTGLFPIASGSDLKDSAVNAAYLGGPFLGLPNRDYYLQDDEANKQTRAAYIATDAKLLSFAGRDSSHAPVAAQAVYDFEHDLAKETLSREEQQNVLLSYNPTSITALAVEYPLMDWRQYEQTLGLSDQNELIVTEATYMKALDGIVRRTSISTLKDYLSLQVLWDFSNNLGSDIEQIAFDFQGKVLGGQQEMRSLDKRALDQVNGLLGEAVGKLYVAEEFPPEAKQQITDLVGQLLRSYHDRLVNNAWMTPETKAKALDKLSKVSVKVGYPDHWRSYSGVSIEGSYAASALSAVNADIRWRLSQIGKPVDRSEWDLPPQVVNAYYNPVNNEIVFPAAILQPPFFDFRADPASNFGGIGFIIGHEITHGFDLQGSQFDANGNLSEWWTPLDRQRFQTLNDRVVAQYSAIEVLPKLFVNGQITVTENVADLGGVQVAYEALEHELARNGQPLPAPPGLDNDAGNKGIAAAAKLTEEQRFFISAATVWRQKIRDESLRTRVKSDVHAPTEVRATQPLRNMDAFFDAFDIEPDDPMYLPPEQRVVIW